MCKLKIVLSKFINSNTNNNNNNNYSQFSKYELLKSFVVSLNIIWAT